MTFEGTATGAIQTIQLVADNKWVLASVPVQNGTWKAGYAFNSAGNRSITALGLDAKGEQVASTSVMIRLQALR